ncbi:hypothetical protein TraAM80_06006 [Trypanosoma rangeli]|uniref:F-box domain-containing protein n=1 Tax=Trypanosoma rangeli TaxID=5698 RepID=A0A422NCD8_TRYRA|nr:uncharacterized protein TraAM80_06006 [Trypanosoma rangeli]RNF03148.1 hypothetical protein TraAM80_06006 [Trypanosoma rangeli]|eukprot:RNF03148.1 hypothetical protein TraAM80_06006 [Trypanosoma rangeli]
MSGIQKYTSAAQDQFDTNTPPRRLHHNSFFDDGYEEVEVVSDTLDAPTAGSAPVKRNEAMNLCSMVPEGDTESDRSSSFESSSDGDACAYHATAATGKTAASSGDGGGHGLPQQNSGTDTTTSYLGSSSSWRTELTASDEERMFCFTEVMEDSDDITERKKREDYHMCSPAIDKSDSFMPPNGRPRWWSFDCLFCILHFCDCYTVCRVMLVCSEFYKLATHDKVWKNILHSMNLRPLLDLPNTPTQGYYRYFIDDIITTRALHGQYSFKAVSADEQLTDIERGRCDSAVRGDMPQYLPSFAEDFNYHIKAATLFFSSASLGQMNHPIGRVQLLIEYSDTSRELIEGVARFSWYRRRFVFCCGSSELGVRGHVFTVAISSVEKPWRNQSMEQFEAHKGGLRFIMAPVLLEGEIPGSRITEMDIVSVSCPSIRRLGVART